MRVERGASQILFGFLPGQTADLEGRIWRVSAWVDPVKLTLDQETVRRSLLGAIRPWTDTGQDGGLAAELHAHATVEVVQLNFERGVVMEPFPQQWRCRSCGRLTSKRVATCRCGQSSLAQMQFIAYHSCGAAREPFLPRCGTHRSVAVRLPGTATARELYFFCPDCGAALSQGFPFQVCGCGAGGMDLTVHRAGVVFSPRFTVIVNPPDPTLAARIRSSGGAARALEWVLDGMESSDPTAGGQTVAGLIETLVQQGLSEETARHLAEEAARRGEVQRGTTPRDLALPAETREKAQEEALSLASATSGGRMRVEDMVAATTPPLRTLYEGAYRTSMAAGRLVNVEFLSSFPVATLAFGFTRGDMNPGASRLVAFRERGQIHAYGALGKTEALLFQLDPIAVHAYLRSRGFAVPAAATPREARLSVLRAVDIPWPTQEHPQALGEAVLALVHSYAHRVIRRLASHAGIERDGLAEYLVPHHLAFVVYAAARGEFVLGGLQAVFESSLHRFLDDFLGGEHRCPLDPGCRSGGGACMACLHLGEPSCRWFNRFLDRATLFGPSGFLRLDAA